MDIDKLRRETPASENRIHFNNAGASMMPNPVLESVVNYLKSESLYGGYEAADLAKRQLAGFYELVAKLINADAEEVAFAESATRAWSMAFYSFQFKAGDKVLIGRSEYVSNYIALLQVANHSQLEIVIIPDDKYGQICVSTLERSIDEKVKLVAVTHVPTNGGLINPVAAIGEICERKSIPYLVDACQSLGQMPVDVKKIKCSFLCGTGRKFLRGPRGTGFLYAKKALITKYEPPFLDLNAAQMTSQQTFTIRADAKRFESWECSYAGKVGLAKAIEYALEIGIANIHARIQFLAQGLRSELSAMSGITVHDRGVDQCGIITFTINSKDSGEVAIQLRKAGINLSVSLADFAGPDLKNIEAGDYLRASLHYYNTESEVKCFVNFIRKVAGLADSCHLESN